MPKKNFLIRNVPGHRSLSAFLIVLVTFQSLASGQTPRPQTQSFRVIALAGNGESNDMERRIMAPLVVQVLDQEARPVEGADVTFRFPSSGPGAVFANGERSQTFRTNADGQAAAIGWTANGIGHFQVQISAVRNNEIGAVTVTMNNVDRVATTTSRHKSWWSSGWFKTLVIAGAAGAVTGVVLTRTGGGNDSRPPVTISVGTPTIGGGVQ